jgi:exosortase/archaeosortase family protein
MQAVDAERLFLRAGAVLRSALPGVAVLIPLLPVLVLCIASSHLNFTPYGLNRIGLIGFVVAALWRLPQTTPDRAVFWSLIVPVSILGIWMSLAGFMSLSLFLGLSAIVLWREGCRTEFSLYRATAPILVLAAICLPALPVDHITIPRNISLWTVDRFLSVVGIPFRRVGVTYFLSSADITVLESCSGTATWRVAFTLLGLLCMYQRRYRAVLFFAVPVSAILALSSNSIRIALHILLTLMHGAVPSPVVHTLLGSLVFGALLFPVIVLLVRRGRLSALPRMRPLGGQGWRMRAAFLLLLASSSVVCFAVPWQKQIGHDFYSVVAPNGGRTYINAFVEQRGGAGWGLLDHPLEFCTSLRGWSTDGLRSDANQRGATISAQFRYGADVAPQSSRNREFVRRILYPSRWFTPLYVSIEIREAKKSGRAITQTTIRNLWGTK